MATNAPLVIVGMPPGARHELGALAFATALRRRGVAVVYLGPDVPVRSWVHAVAAARAAGAVLGVVREEDAAGAGEVVDAVHVAAPQARLAIGGKEAGRVVSIAPLVVLPSSVVDAAEAMERAVR